MPARFCAVWEGGSRRRRSLGWGGEVSWIVWVVEWVDGGVAYRAASKGSAMVPLRVCGFLVVGFVCLGKAECLAVCGCGSVFGC